MKRLTFVGLFSLLLLLGGLTLTTVLAAPSAAPKQVSGTPACSPIITNTTWTVISSPYVVCGNGALSVAKGITLTVEPGVEVQFQSNSRLTVNGRLYAVGTSEQPITFTGVVTTPGSWQGIGIYGTLTETNRSVLDHVLIEYGGINIGSSAQLYLDHAAITLTHSLIRNGQLHGIYGAAGGMANLDDVAFENNAGYAVYFADGTVNPVLRHLTASGNGTNGVGLGGFAFLTGTYVWENSGVPYVMVGTSQVAIGSKLIIEPGVEVQFRQNQSAAHLRANSRLSANPIGRSPLRAPPKRSGGGAAWKWMAIFSIRPARNSITW